MSVFDLFGFLVNILIVANLFTSGGLERAGAKTHCWTLGSLNLIVTCETSYGVGMMLLNRFTLD